MKQIGRWLAYMRRAQGYYSMISAMVMLVILMTTKGIDLKWYWYPVMFFLIIAVGVVFGYFEQRSGIRKYEMLNNEMNQPIRMEIYKTVKEILKKLNETNNK